MSKFVTWPSIAAVLFFTELPSILLDKSETTIKKFENWGKVKSEEIRERIAMYFITLALFVVFAGYNLHSAYFGAVADPDQGIELLVGGMVWSSFWLGIVLVCVQVVPLFMALAMDAIRNSGKAAFDAAEFASIVGGDDAKPEKEFQNFKQTYDFWIIAKCATTKVWAYNLVVCLSVVLTQAYRRPYAMVLLISGLVLLFLWRRAFNKPLPEKSQLLYIKYTGLACFVFFIGLLIHSYRTGEWTNLFDKSAVIQEQEQIARELADKNKPSKTKETNKEVEVSEADIEGPLPDKFKLVRFKNRMSYDVKLSSDEKSRPFGTTNQKRGTLKACYGNEITFNVADSAFVHAGSLFSKGKYYDFDFKRKTFKNPAGKVTDMDVDEEGYYVEIWDTRDDYNCVPRQPPEFSAARRNTAAPSEKTMRTKPPHEGIRSPHNYVRPSTRKPRRPPRVPDSYS